MAACPVTLDAARKYLGFPIGILQCNTGRGSVSDPAPWFHRNSVKKALFLAQLGDVNPGKFGDAALGRPRATLGSRPRMGRLRAR